MPNLDLDNIVFFVTRIGSEFSDARRRSDDLMDFLLVPAVKDLDSNLEVVRADKLAAHGRITDKIVQHILYSALVIVDATGLNPNVFYELGIAHARHRPVILLINDPDLIPFDTKNEAYLILPGDSDLTVRTVEDSKPRLAAALHEARRAEVPPGPVASAEAMLVQPKISPDEATEILRETIGDLVARMDNLERRVAHPPSKVQHSSINQDLLTLAKELDHRDHLVSLSRTHSITPALRSFVEEMVELFDVPNISTIQQNYETVIVEKFSTPDDETPQFTLRVTDGESTIRNLGHWFGLSDTDIRQMLQEFRHLLATYRLVSRRSRPYRQPSE